MKKMRLFTVVMLLALTLVSAGVVQAQQNNPKCAPLSPEAVEEIAATRGSAAQKFCPDYVVLGVAAAKTISSSTRTMVEEIAATRGSAASKYFGPQMLVIIPVTSSDRQLAPTQAVLERIIATRGEWHLGTQGK